MRLTFYKSGNGRGAGGPLIHNQTVAIPRQLMNNMGISFGQQIYINSNRGWSGWYTVTDICGTAGTIDIYTEGSIPTWGTESGVSIST